MYTIYAYWNAEQITAMLNGIALIMNGGDFLGLIKAIAIAALLVSAGTALVKMRGEEPLGYFIMFAIFYGVLFVPRTTVSVQDLRTGATYTVANVPLGVGFFKSQTSHIGKWLTENYETYFTAVDDEKFSKNGMVFGARLIGELQQVTVTRPTLKNDLTTFVKDCVNPELLDKPSLMDDLVKAPDLWAYIGGSSGFSMNPGRATAVGGIGLPCTDAYVALGTLLVTEASTQAANIGNRLNAGNAMASTLIMSQIPAIEGSLLNVSRSAVDAIKQGMVGNMLIDSQESIASQMSNAQTTAVRYATTSAFQSSNTSYMAMAKVAESALPKLRNGVELITLAVFPIVFLLVVAAGIKGGLVMRSYIMALIWVELWAPLYAVINYMMTSAARTDLMGVLKTTTGTLSANTLEVMGRLNSTTIDSQSIAGLLTISVPMIALALIKGGEVAMSGVVSSIMSPAQGSAQRSGDAASQGNINAGNMSWGTTSMNNWNSGNWGGGNSSFNNTSGNSDDRSGKYTDPKMNRSTDQFGSDISTTGSSYVTSIASGSSTGSLSSAATASNDRSKDKFSGSESGTGTKTTAALQSSTSAITSALQNAGYSKEYGNALNSVIESGNSYQSSTRASLAGSAERGTSTQDTAGVATTFSGGATIGTRPSSAPNAGAQAGKPGASPASNGPSTGSVPSSGTVIDAATGKVLPAGSNVPAISGGAQGNRMGAALDSLLSAMPGRTSIGGQNSASVGSSTSLNDAVRSVMGNEQAYQVAKSAADKLAQTGSTAEIRSMASQFSASLQAGRTATLASETSATSSSNAGERSSDRSAIGSSMSMKNDAAVYRALDGAGFSRPEARAALENPDHPRRAEAMAIANGVTTDSTGSSAPAAFQSGSLPAPKTEAEMQAKGAAAVATADSGNRAAVEVTNQSNQAQAAKQQMGQMVAGQEAAPSNLNTTAAVSGYGGNVGGATQGLAVLANSREGQAGVSAFTSWAQKDSMAAKGVLGAVLSQPEGNRSVSRSLEMAMQKDPELNSMVRSIGQSQLSGGQTDEAQMEQVASRLKNLL